MARVNFFRRMQGATALTVGSITGWRSDLVVPGGSLSINSATDRSCGLFVSRDLAVFAAGIECDAWRDAGLIQNGGEDEVGNFVWHFFPLFVQHDAGHTHLN